jgi:hypothetical protein
VEENVTGSIPTPQPAAPLAATPAPTQKIDTRFILLGAALIALAILLAPWIARHSIAVTFDKPYQAVLLSNGQVYYGRLEGYGTSQPVLREVYYIQVQTNPETKQQTNILLKRGKEWHAPDRMYLNPNQILLVEPVGTESKVADLIKELRAQ